MKKLYIGFAIAIIIAFGFGVVSAQRVVPTVKADDCQYPTRDNTNGCDNSDPCDPENIKNGGDCADKPAPAPTPAPAPVAAPPVNKCQ